MVSCRVSMENESPWGDHTHHVEFGKSLLQPFASQETFEAGRCDSANPELVEAEQKAVAD